MVAKVRKERGFSHTHFPGVMQLETTSQQVKALLYWARLLWNFLFIYKTDENFQVTIHKRGNTRKICV